jgi:large subunit ribosomal protein L30e
MISLVNIDEKIFRKTMKAIVKDGKYEIGLKESMKSLKNVKLLVYSDNLNELTISKIEKSCKKSSVPTIAYPGSSMTLGHICGKPFKVSSISVKSTGDADISTLINYQT